MAEFLRMKESDKDYYVLVNYPELLGAALSKGFDNVTLFEGSEVTPAMKAQASAEKKSIVRIYYTEGEPRSRGFGMSDMDCDDLPRFVFNVLFELNGAEFRKDKVSTLEDAARLFPSVKLLEKILKHEGVIMERDYKDKCGNCHAVLEKEDKYCRYCGTPRGEGAFEPYRNEILLLYGPPIRSKFTCPGCGYSWTSSGFGGDPAKYCPKCGSKVKVQEEPESDDLFL